MKNKRQIISGSIITVLSLFFMAYAFAENILIPATAVKSVLEGASITEQIAGFEGNYNSAFTNKTAFVDINGLGRRVLLQREMAGVYLMDNGHVTAVVGQPPEEGIKANADSVIAFSQWFETEKDGNFIYVQVPMKNSKYDDQLPNGLVDYSNDTADKFLAFLGDDVDKIDLRENIQSDGVDFYSLYLRTEHHWNGYGGFYAFQEICQYMQEHFGTEIDPDVLDVNNYENVVLEETSLGHYGQKTGQFFAGYDEFPVLIPKFETQQSCFVTHRDITRTGDFYDAIFDKDFLKAEKRNRGLYGMYIGGDFPLVIHESETAKNPETVMVFIDSYGTIVESYLTTAFQKVVAVDLRWVLRKGMEESAVDFIELYQPDTVIVMFNPNQIGSAESEQFKYGLPED